jgi:phospholipase C
MAQYASRILSTDIDMVPGEVKTFRLPTMTPGAFIVQSTALPFALSTPQLAGVPHLHDSGGGVLGNPGGSGGVLGNPDGPGGPGGPLGNPGVLLLELLHGDQVVQSGQTLVPQSTPSSSDPAWRLQLAPGTPDQTYPFKVTVNFSSLLPILTRRIPLDAFQQGFDKNWNGHNYVYATITNNTLFLSFDPALAFYYNLKDQATDIPLPVITLNNARTGPIHFSTGSSDSPFDWISGRFPYIQLDVPIVHTEANNQIAIHIPVVGDIVLADFTLTFKLYLMSQGPNLMFATRFESGLLDRIPTSFHPPGFNKVLQDLSGQIGTELTTGNGREDLRAAVQYRIDHHTAPVAKAVKPWLVGADFDLINVRHEQATTSADPFGGFIVIDYVGQILNSSPVLTTGVGPVTPITDPFLFPDALYVPRGDGDSMWKPALPSTLGINQQPLEHSTTPGTLASMDHIVVVMMENRSFDHMLGYLSLEGGRTDVDGLSREPDGKLRQVNYFAGHDYFPQPITDTSAVRYSPHHGHLATKAQMADGMKHFVSNYAKIVGNDPENLALVMGYYGAKQLPVYDLLAREFMICDRWFSSHIGPTWPNRFVALTGDLNRDTFGEPETDTPDYTDLTPVETSTLFDHLNDRQVSWHYFQTRFGTLRTYTKYTFDTTNVTEFDNVVNGFLPMVRNGRLPSVTFIDPSFGDLPPGNDDAPPADLRDGQTFIASILHTLFGTTNPFWDRTMLIICYDEHGGFYDHVDPPDNGIPLLGQTNGKLGPRVPAFVVSALTPGGAVLHDVLDHSSIAATILRRFCSPHPPHMSARVTAARDLRNAISLKNPRDLRAMFDPPAILGTLLAAPGPRTGSSLPPDSDHSLLAAIGLIVGSTA